MRTRFLLLALVLGLSVGVGLITGLLTDGAQPVSAGHTDVNANALPHGTYQIWDLNFQATPDDPLFGFDPNMTVSDPNGATIHVATAADPFTNVTVMENTFCSGLPCGVTYWNHKTNVFKCYGYSSGAMTGVDVNVSGPLIAPPAGTAATPTNGGNYGQGDVWLAKSGLFEEIATHTHGSEPLSVQFPGTNVFRAWGAGNLSSVAVDQATGLVWFTDQGGFIGVLDPGTNVVTRWDVGGVPRDIVVDPLGQAYATVGPVIAPGGEIIRINLAAAVGSQVTKWTVPGGGLQGFFAAHSENPNGIGFDSAGRIWFSETLSDEVGRLDTATNEFAEYTKVGLDEPQNVAASGIGGNLQTFFGEGNGDAVGIVTEIEAAGTIQETTTIVPSTMPDIAPTIDTLTPFDHEHEPSQKTIVPTTHDSPGVDGVPWTDPGPTTGAGEVIPGVLRFPFPAGFERAVGMTQVNLPNTVFGSLVGPAGSFPDPPVDEHVFKLESPAIIAEPEGEEGRMTGGGTITNGEGTRHGFTLHCDAGVSPNRLQVNFGRGNKFHLDTLDSAACSDDPAIDEGHPVAGFDTYVGSGTGRYNGVSGATIEFTFTDAGEPGLNDIGSIKIVDAGGDTVLDVSGNIRFGDQQAHADDGLVPAVLPARQWVFTESGWRLVFPMRNRSDPNTELCSE